MAFGPWRWNVEGELMRISYATLAVIAMSLGASACLGGDKAKDPPRRFFHVRYQVLDRTGRPVPNAKVRVVLVDEQGRPYGPTSSWTGSRTDADGKGGLGLGTYVKEKPGSVQLAACRQAVGGVALCDRLPRESLSTQ